MTFKEYASDNGFKSRKFILTLLAILMTTGVCITWALLSWDLTILNQWTDTMLALVLGYSGISSLRSAIPATTGTMGKQLAPKTTTQTTISSPQTPVAQKQPAPNPSQLKGPSDQI